MRHQLSETGLGSRELPRDNGMTVKQKVVLHLFRNKSYIHKYVAPFAVCQRGIAESIGVSRAHVAVELGFLRKKGFVTEEWKHIRGFGRKRKTYTLTSEGFVYAREVCS